MGILKFGLFVIAIYVIFVAKKSPAKAVGRSFGRFISGVREGMTETNSLTNSTEPQEREVIEIQASPQKDIHK